MTNPTATTPTYSDAANKYVADVPGHGSLGEARWGDVRAAYDAGAAATIVEIAKVWLKGEPVRLTDPADPRIRDGARVRIDYTIGGPAWDADEVREWVDGDEPVYLLAEAPDLDAGMLQHIAEVLGEIGIDVGDAEDDAPVVLAGLRGRGVVK